MPAKPRLRVVDTQQSHPRDIARQIVRKKQIEVLQPVVNQHVEVVRPILVVDEVLRRSEGAGLGKK